ncbi:ABC transporter ATP-binding protein [Ammoniphilus sp. CFH 90114]|uniref:ABC transporter ATP-binding protein n=1 Tax=Ammoniphilus sp. CFH 90114 TaxID=2493665 RepID=UPI00100D9D1B|nr:ATP-binding cassette domain-containing protein [Ammoniphilus sp. CFH 90114]RXT07800.1 ATP-binding cassette domain-containing protein [Ammoniphilus sp. CFH 90114]
MIKLQDVHFIRHDRSILSHIELNMRKGEQWIILGKNGSGKTTLLELIAGYQFPSKGTVEVNGYKYTECDVREARKKIGYISQTLLEKLTLRDPVWEVVATGEYGYLRFYEPVPDTVKEKAIHLLESVRIAHLKDHPLGSLSQGERKKVMLARALMNDPEILIMDEPCAGLDLWERENLLSSIEQMQNEQVIQMIYVTHHIEEVMPFFTHVVLVDQGTIAAKGKKEEVLTAELLSSAFQVPLAVEWHEGRPWIKVSSQG